MSLRDKNRRFETIQISSRIAKDLVLELKRQAKQRQTTESSILEAALETFFNQTEHASVIDRRLNKLQEQNGEMKRELQILLETVATFVKVYLAHTPEIQASQKQLFEENSLPRFERFIRLIVRSLENETLFRQAIDEKMMPHQDFNRES